MYAVMVSMGFAATENIIYVLNGGLGVAIVRAFTAVPAHATFAILMGLLLAILFHGAYDFFLFIDFVPGIWIGAFVSLIVGIILAHRAMVLHQRASYFKPE